MSEHFNAAAEIDRLIRLIRRSEYLRQRLARLHAGAERIRREMERAEQEWAMIGEAIDIEEQRRDFDLLLKQAARALVDPMPAPGSRRGGV